MGDMGSPNEVQWRWLAFDEITGSMMHEILSVRQNVFVVEQRCIYRDADDFDKDSLHLTGRDASGRLVAYLRLNFPGSRYREPSIGRVLTVADVRGQKIGFKSVELAIEKCRSLFNNQPVKVSAQFHLAAFYQTFGFEKKGEPYDEDGIDHIDMILEV